MGRRGAARGRQRRGRAGHLVDGLDEGVAPRLRLGRVELDGVGLGLGDLERRLEQRLPKMERTARAAYISEEALGRVAGVSSARRAPARRRARARAPPRRAPARGRRTRGSPWPSGTCSGRRWPPGRRSRPQSPSCRGRGWRRRTAAPPRSPAAPCQCPPSPAPPATSPRAAAAPEPSDVCFRS